MARIRTVKPEMWTDEDFIDLSMPARLIFIASLNFADDWGVLADKPRTLAARCMPRDDIDPQSIVDELVAARFYVRHTSPEGAAVLVIRTFASHQKIDRRTRGRWGDPAEWVESPPIPPDPTTSPPIPPTEGKGREGKGSIPPTQSRDILTVRPVGNFETEEEDSRIADAIDHIVNGEYQAASNVRSPKAWKQSARTRTTTELNGELIRLCAKYPRAPYDVIASAAQGEGHSLAYFTEPETTTDDETSAQ